MPNSQKHKLEAESNGHSKAQLELKNLSLRQQHNQLINNLNCQFKTGQFWGVVGQNGTGKSTLLHAMAGLKTPSNGQIIVDGQELATITPLMRAQKISLLLQDQEPCLAVSVKDAVAMGRFPWRQATNNLSDNDGIIIEKVLSNCQLEHLKQRSILNLSGGERRKVEIATCLAQQADYLLLDEPLNHLDLVFQAHMLTVLKNFSQRRCVVMVCHDLEAVRQHCSHVLMLLANDCYLSGTSATMLNEANLKQLFTGRRFEQP